MRVLLLVGLTCLGALAECASQNRQETISTLPQEGGERYQNDVISLTPEQSDGGKSQPPLSDKEVAGYITGTGTNVPDPLEAMRKEMNTMKMDIDVTKAAVLELNQVVEHIMQILDEISESHRKTEKQDDDEENEDKDDEDEDEDEEDEEDEDEDTKEKDNDYQEVNDNTRVVVTLNKKAVSDQLSCPPEFMDFDNQCLLLKADQRGSYTMAEQECAKHKGRLAIPSNPRGLAFLATSFYPDSDEYWVGLRYNSTTEDWRRNNGNLDLNSRKLLGLMDKTDYSVGAECALLKIRPTILWQAQPCGYFYNFICEADRVK